MTNRLSLLIILISILCGASYAGNRHVRHITIDNGLSSNAVYCIAQDDLGRMWFGTIDGLHSYDGNLVSIWRDPEIRTLGQVIYTIKEDSDHRLWIGSDMGLAIFDLKKEHFSTSPLEAAGIRIIYPVSDILFDKKGRAWVSTAGQGVFRFDKGHDKIENFVAMGRINSDVISHIFEDRHGTIWAASPEQGISCYDENDNIFVPVKSSPKGTVSIYEDKAGNLWVGCVDGLYSYDRKHDIWTHAPIPTDKNVFQVRQIIEHSPGTLLIASDEGLTRFDVTSGASSTIKANPDIADYLNDNYLHSLFIDREDGLWIGTYFGGVNYISPTLNRFTHYNNRNSSLPARIISVFADSSDGNVWIGSDDAGFFLWNRNDNSFKSFNNSSNPGLTYHNIHALLQADNKLYIGMYMGGLDILDLKTSEFKNHRGGMSPNSLYSSSVYALFKDSRGDIWIGTTKGLNKYRKDTGDFDRIFDLNHADVEYIFEDSAGFIYACTLNQGLYRFNPDTKEWRQYTTLSEKNKEACGLPTYKIITGAEDNDGNLWFGTDGWGLFRFDPDKERFVQESLPMSIRVINKIVPHGDNLWITTSNGMYRYSPDSGKIQTFDRTSGLQENLFMPNSGTKLSDGTILVGGVNGFNAFNPADFEMKANNPRVILSELTIFNRRASVDTEGSPLTSSLAYSDKLTLRHEHSIFSVSVAVLSYVNPAQNDFLYKLEGVDPDWNNGPTDGRISYTNLPPGNYRLLVRASDGTGGWNDESLAFPIEVLSPWWMSWPMKVLYATVVVACFIIGYRRLKRKQLEEMQTLSDKKDRELYQSKIDFFTHMVHEIRTPLTLILTPLDSVMKSTRSVREELPTLNVIARNGQRLLNLVNRLMDFRKMESGCVSVDLKAVNVLTIIDEAYRNILPMAYSKGIQVSLFSHLKKCYAEADPDALRHVMENLLSNALKFTADHIWIEIDEGDNGYWRISVKDNGQGIRKDEQEKIFTPFYQIAETRPHDNIGTGIGLLLVKEYVRLMHGRLHLDSIPGRGSAFSICLLKTDTEPLQIEKANTDSLVSCVHKDDEAGKNIKDRILIVEDNAELLSFLRSLFEGTYDVICAENGKAALDILEENPCDMVISDVMMPEINGIELCKRIKSDFATSHVPVVLLTAKVESDDFIEGFENGADLYVTKPFSSDVLKAQVKGILKIRRQLRKNFRENPNAKIAELVPDSGMDNVFIKKFEEIVMRHISDPDFNIESLARELAVSRTVLFTKLKAIADMTPNALIKRIRLNEAARLIREEGYLVNEASADVGFVSRSHFARYFQQQFGMTPAEYKSAVANKG